MKILHYLGSPSEGGVASVVYNISKYVVDHGHSVDLFSRFTVEELGDTSNTFDKLGMRIFSSPTSNRFNIQQLLHLRTLMKEYDILHVHQFPQQMWGAFAALIKNSNENPRIITTEHSTWNNRRNHKFLRAFDRWMYAQYDRIVCISPSTTNELKNWLKSDSRNKKIVTITNGIDIEKYSKANSELGKYVELDQMRKYIVMAARLDHPKDPHTLIKAMSQLPESIHLIFLGDGALRESSELLSKELGIAERVHFLGYLSDISGIIKGCDIGVLSTFWDGFGLAAAEYMAAGLPAIVSDVAGLRDVVGNPELTFKPQDSDRLATILNRLLQDGQYYRHASEQCLERAGLFSAEEMGRSYLRIYEEVLNE